ncbi:hypothetical protein TgHK011_000562 [Trichoderma gracile]|nr:hypothetical protein TgHK011_000562 [Trichoderma gracile]
MPETRCRHIQSHHGRQRNLLMMGILAVALVHTEALRDKPAKGATSPSGIRHGTSSPPSSIVTISIAITKAWYETCWHSASLWQPMRQMPSTTAASPRHLRALQQHLGLPKRRAASQNVLAAQHSTQQLQLAMALARLNPLGFGSDPFDPFGGPADPWYLCRSGKNAASTEYYTSWRPQRALSTWK